MNQPMSSKTVICMNTDIRNRLSWQWLPIHVSKIYRPVQRYQISNLISAPYHNTGLCACVISCGSRKRFQNFLSDKKFKFVHYHASYFGDPSCSTLHSFPIFGYSFIYTSLQLAHLGCPAVAATWPVSYYWADQMCNLPPTSRGHAVVALQRPS